MRLGRRRGLWWGATALLALLVAATVQGQLSLAANAQAAWGETVDVAVVTEPLAPGDAVGGAFEWRQHPRVVVDGSALTAVPPDAVAITDLYPGEVLTIHRVKSADDHRAALVEGRVIFGVDPAATLVDVHPGDTVTLFASGAAAELANRARIVEVGAEAIMVAVTPQEAPAVAAAVAARTLVVARVAS